MTSNFECVGLGGLDRAAFNRLLSPIMAESVLLGERDGLTVRRWTDPSGVRLVLTLRGGKLQEILPSFAGTPGARLRAARRVNDEMIVADVLDEEGEQVTMLAAAAEQLHLLGEPADGRGAMIALGGGVTVHPDEDAWHASDASLLGTPEEGADPVRLGAESFISYGVFDQANGEPYALLAGVVLSAERRRVRISGGEFSVARVRTAGFETEVCLSGDLPTPVPGNVLGGTVYLIADLPFVSVPAPRRRSWWRK
ncbi:hypothetical protein [Actinoplanes regularis]|uniref:Uncharacterized protein n=1 Tax=Actinoplanes regularis TaxID=52697 RepID=A0A238WG54_9ACTN|nr:hypothetical protein [Actinoplanes regularis]GIE84939.1 hypothetical protein Are01nite_14190 [Actinoplanes regularis]SNR45273.1 hypothetical protein SAMN06264365_102489 [Actinoplanes regularis]